MDLNDFTLEKNEQGCFLITGDKKFNISDIVSITVSHFHLQVNLYATEKNIDNNSYCFDLGSQEVKDQFVDYITDYFKKSNIPHKEITSIYILKDNDKIIIPKINEKEIEKATEATLKLFDKFIKAK